ncbi:hypothetical protein EPO04_04295 [Patescibacteria group bacterium]|nr:MAG: hypothetical protein EPO04_04295 [Patescibacteria group bacterium]
MHVTSISHKGIGALNEDRVLINDEAQTYGVFDGVSSLSGYLSPDKKTGGHIASTLAGTVFSSTAYDLKDLALKTNEAIEQAHIEAGLDVTNNAYRFGCTAAVVRINKGNQAELLQIGDSIIICINTDGSVDTPLGYHDHDKEIMRTWRKLADQGVKDIREKVASDMIKLRASANSAYSLLNGDSRLGEMIKTTTISLNKIAAILMLTDGIYLPKENPETAEDWHELVQLYARGGLSEIYDKVRELENSDPELTQYPRYKLHDDASGVAIELLQPTS